MMLLKHIIPVLRKEFCVSEASKIKKKKNEEEPFKSFSLMKKKIHGQIETSKPYEPERNLY